MTVPLSIGYFWSWWQSWMPGDQLSPIFKKGPDRRKLSIVLPQLLNSLDSNLSSVNLGVLLPNLPSYTVKTLALLICVPNPVFHSRMKHIAFYYNFVRETVFSSNYKGLLQVSSVLCLNQGSTRNSLMLSKNHSLGNGSNSYGPIFFSQMGAPSFWAYKLYWYGMDPSKKILAR